MGPQEAALRWGWDHSREVVPELGWERKERPQLANSLEGVGLRAFQKLRKGPRNPTNGDCSLQGLLEKTSPIAPLNPRMP